MLDFVFGLERLIGKWPAVNAAPPAATAATGGLGLAAAPSPPAATRGQKETHKELTITQIAETAGTGVAVAVDALAVALAKELDVQDVITLNEANTALKVLREKLAPQIEARARRIAARRDEAIKAYDNAIDKVRVLEAARNVRSAYRTLTYFVGVHENDLPAELLVSLYGDLLRLGSKSNANLQELGQWLRKGIQAALANPSREALLDALDFIDAYSEDFMQHSTGQGDRVLASVVGTLAEPASRFELHTEWRSLASQVGKEGSTEF